MHKNLFLLRLQEGLAQLKLDIPSDSQNLLIDYLLLLHKWNKTHNLTGIQDVERMISYHLLDSLSIAPFIKGPRIVDVGTGAGIPGIPLAVLFPEYEFFLLENRRKKILFLKFVVPHLKLKNITIVHERSDAYAPLSKFNTVITRATGTLADFITKTKHLVAENGVLLAMKGQYPQRELEELDPAHFSTQVHPLTVPFLNQTRHLVVIEPTMYDINAY